MSAKTLGMAMGVLLSTLGTLTVSSAIVQERAKPLLMADSIKSVTTNAITPTQFCARFDPRHSEDYLDLHEQYVSGSEKFRVKLRDTFFNSVRGNNPEVLQRVESIVDAVKQDPQLMATKGYAEQRAFITEFFDDRCASIRGLLKT